MFFVFVFFVLFLKFFLLIYFILALCEKRTFLSGRVLQFDLIFKYLNQIFDQIQIQIWLYLIWSNSNMAIFDLIWKLLLKIQIQIKFKFKYLNQIKFKSRPIWFDQIQIDPIFDLIWIWGTLLIILKNFIIKLIKQS